MLARTGTKPLVPNNLWDDLLMEVEPRFLPNDIDDSNTSETPDLGVVAQQPATERNMSYDNRDLNVPPHGEAESIKSRSHMCVPTKEKNEPILNKTTQY